MRRPGLSWGRVGAGGPQRSTALLQSGLRGLPSRGPPLLRLRPSSGLIIVNAWYGKFVNDKSKKSEKVKVIDVTVPLQCLVKDSKLILTEASKVRLLPAGFRHYRPVGGGGGWPLGMAISSRWNPLVARRWLGGVPPSTQVRFTPELFTSPVPSARISCAPTVCQLERRTKHTSCLRGAYILLIPCLVLERV